MKKKSARLYFKLFSSTFTLSAFTFGGGYVIVPLMKKKFVEKLGWIEEDEMLDLIALAQSSPGPIAVNASILVGYRMAGVSGAMITMLGTVLPPLVIMSAVAILYSKFSENPLVTALVYGMKIGVAAVIIDVVISMASKIIKSKDVLSIIIMLLAFVAVAVFKISVLWVFACCIIIGIITTLLSTRKGREAKK